MGISFWDFISLGRPQWRGQSSLFKALYFLMFGTPDAHTRIRNSYVLNRVEQLNLPPKSNVLDAGCGRAVSLFWLARRHPDWYLTGIELDPVLSQPAHRAIEHGRWVNMTIIESTIQAMNIESAYDLILAIDMLEHIENDIGLLRQFHQALKPNGYLVIHVPRRRQEQWRWLPAFRNHEVDTHVRNEYTSEELCPRVEEAGLRIVSLRETIGRLGEISFELNQLFWPWSILRYLFSVLTYPIAMLIGYLDICRDPSRGNSLLLTATRD